MARFSTTSTGSTGTEPTTDSTSSSESTPTLEERRKRVEPEDSIREKESKTESDPMTDVGDTTSNQPTVDGRNTDAPTQSTEPTPDTKSTPDTGSKTAASGATVEFTPSKSTSPSPPAETNTQTTAVQPSTNGQLAQAPGEQETTEAPTGTGPETPPQNVPERFGGAREEPAGEPTDPPANQPPDTPQDTPTSGGTGIGPNQTVDDVESGPNRPEPVRSGDTGKTLGFDDTASNERVVDAVVKEYGNQDFQFAEVDGATIVRFQEGGETRYVPVSTGADELPEGVRRTLGSSVVSSAFEDDVAGSLEYGEDYTYQPFSGGGLSLTESGKREVLADQYSDKYPGAGITASSISGVSPAEDGSGFQGELTAGARRRVQEAAVERRLGVSDEDIRVTDEGQVTPLTDEGAKALAEFGATSSTVDASEVSVSQVAPGVFQAQGRNTGGRIRSPGNRTATSTVATPEGQGFLKDAAVYRDIETETAIAAAKERQEDRAGQIAEDLLTGRLAAVDKLAGEQSQADNTTSEANRRGLSQGGETSDLSPTAAIEAQLEADTGVELSESDITFSRTQKDGKTVVTGSLSRSGQKKIAKENAPLQGTPLEGITEAGAAANFEYEQAAEGFNAEFNRVTPDTGDFVNTATAVAPLAAAEPTPAGEVGVGGLVALGGLAAAGASLKAGEQSSQRSFSASAVAQNTVNQPDELDVPTDGVFQSEVEVTGTSTQFASEVGVPDPSEQDVGPRGVPELGIQIGTGDSGGVTTTEVDIPTEGLFAGEVAVPDTTEETPETTVQTQQLIGQQTGRSTREESGRRVGDRRRNLPEEFIPDEQVIIGEDSPTVGGGGFPSVPARPGSGLIVGNGSGVGFVGRRPNPESTLPVAREQFFDVALSDLYTSQDVTESAQSSQATGQQPNVGPLAGFGTPNSRGRGRSRSAIESDVAVDSRVDVLSGIESGVLQASDRAASVDATAPEFGVENRAAFDAVEADAYEYVYEAEVTSNGNRRPRFFDLETQSDAGDAEARGAFRDQFTRELPDPLTGDSGSTDSTLFGESTSNSDTGDGILGGFL